MADRALLFVGTKMIGKMKGSPHVNPGNFMVQLQFRAQSGDKVVAEYLQAAHHHHNAPSTSKTSKLFIGFGGRAATSEL